MQPVTVDMWLRMTTPYPDKSLACGYWAMKSSTNQEGQPVVPVSRCLAEPGWLAGISGLEGRRPGGASLKLAYDPATVDIAALDATPRWVRVTGAFSNPGSSACRTTDRATGIDLVDPAEAALYCESVFVVTAIAPPAGPEPE